MTLYNFFTRDFNLRTKLQRKESPKASKERNNFPGSLPQELLIIPHYWQGWVHQLFSHCLPSNPQLALRSAHHPLMLCSAPLPKEKKMVKNSGLEPHRGAFFGFLSLSLSGKRKKVNIFQLELPLHWFGRFSAKPCLSEFVLVANCSCFGFLRKIILNKTRDVIMTWQLW